jgi:integrase
MHGKEPLWPSSAMSKHIRPAAKLAGIVKHVRWHVFRHSFATLLKGNGEDGTRVIATRGQQSHAGHVHARVDASETGSTAKGHCDDWTHVDPRNFRKCLIAKVGRVAQLVEQCPFNQV